MIKRGHFVPKFITVITVLVIAVFGVLGMTLLSSRVVSAADLQQGEGCSYGDGKTQYPGVRSFGLYTSPYSATPDVCLGTAQQGYYFQLVVNVPISLGTTEAVSKGTVEVIDSGGRSIPMKYDGTRLGSDTSVRFLSTVAVAVLGGDTCNQSETMSITVKIAGAQNNPIPKKTICTKTGSFNGSNSDNWLINVTANGPATTPSGDPSTAPGTQHIVGYLGVDFGEALNNNASSRYHKLQKNGVTWMKLTKNGNVVKKCGKGADSNDVCSGVKWLGLTDGVLRINDDDDPTLDPGSGYALEFSYSATAADSSLNLPDDTWRSGHTFKFSGITVPVKDDVNITQENGGANDNIVYYDKDGNTTLEQDSVEEATADKAVCTGGALGWILCPIADMANSVIGSLAGLIEQQLTYQPLLGSDQGAAIQKVWRIVVNIANILLVVAFMVVIFSQATSVGLSAYGIKKMLPRIIAAAILINLSFFICALAVDISNILGASVQGIIQGIPLPKSDLVQDASSGWNGWFIFVATGLAGYAVWSGAVFYIAPFLLTAAATLFMAFVVLAVRQVMITMLIIIAPLAFAAFVLPNTDSLFKKWQKLFTILLLMYPLIMLIFYGSGLMSQLMMSTKTTDDGGMNNIIIDIMALVILFVPLFILPTIMKLTGGIMERIGAFVNDREKGLIDRSNKWAGDRKNQRGQDIKNRRTGWLGQNQSAKGFKGFMARRGTTFDPTMRKIKRDEWSRQYDEAAKLSAAKVASGAISKSWRASGMQKARAEATLSELDMKEAKIKLDFQFNGDPAKAIEEAMEKGDKALMKLSAGKFTDTAQLEVLQKIMANDSRITDKHVASISDHLKDSHFAKVKEQDLGMMYAMTDPNGLGGNNGKYELGQLMKGGSGYDIKAMGASDAAIGGQEKYVLDRQTGWNDDPSVKAYTKPRVLSETRAEQILDDPNLKGQIKAGQRDILGAGTAATSPHHRAHP